MENSYEQDEHCQHLLQQLAIALDKTSHYTPSGDILRYKGGIYIGKEEHIKEQIINSFHTSALGGHSGMVANYQRIKRIFYWPGLKKQVHKFIAECAICQRAKSEHCQYPGLLDPLPLPTQAWTDITMDFVEGLPKSKGKEVILVVVDRYTKYAHFIALPHPYNVQTVAQAFIDIVFKLHGPPVSIVTDRDRIFTSNMWQAVFKSMDFQLKLSTAHHPQTEGQSERVNHASSHI